MNNKLYILSFDLSTADINGLHQLIKTSQYINDWWHYLGSTYILSSNYTLDTIQNQIKVKYPGFHFLLMEVDPKAANGWLPKDAWKWINKHK